MRALVSLPDNCGNNPGWVGWSWSTETPTTGLLLDYFLMNPDLFPFVVSFLLLVVPNIYDTQRGTSISKSRNIDGRNPSCASLDMYLG